MKLSNSIAIDQDDLMPMIKKDNLHYLGYLYLNNTGNLYEIPKKVTNQPPKNGNLRMWKCQQLIRLRSDIITISAKIEKIAEKIQKKQDQSLERKFLEMKEEERQKPLGYFRISTHASESEDSFDIQSTPERVSAPHQQEERRTESRRCHSSDRGMTLGQTELTTESQQEKIMKQDLIWENTELFMKPIHNINEFSSVLKPSKVVHYPLTILTDDFGPHYSITIPQNTELFENDPNKSRLILPPPPSLENRHSGISEQLHSRLITSFVDVSPEDLEAFLKYSEEEETIEKSSFEDKEIVEAAVTPSSIDSGNKSKQQNTFDLHQGQDIIDQLIHSGHRNEQNTNFDDISIKLSSKAAPDPAGLGMSPYGSLDFVEKLKLELQSLGFTSFDCHMVCADSPVSKGIEYQMNRQGELVATTNSIKEKTRQLLESRKEAFDDEIKFKKSWDSALEKFLTTQVPLQKKKK